MHISGRKRIAIVVSIVWLMLNYFFFKPFDYYFPHGTWQAFALYGICPVSGSWAWHWVRNSFAAERKEGSVLDDQIRNAVENLMVPDHKILIKSYRYESRTMLYIFNIVRGSESGELVFSGEFIRDHTASGVISRLTSLEVKRQFENINNRRLTVSNIGVRVEIGV
jgi:hypothetical protein